MQHAILAYLLRNNISLLSTDGIAHCNWLFGLQLPAGRTSLDTERYNLMHKICTMYGVAKGYEFLQSDLHLLLTALPTNTILELTHAFTTQKSKLL